MLLSFVLLNAFLGKHSVLHAVFMVLGQRHPVLSLSLSLTVTVINEHHVLAKVEEHREMLKHLNPNC